MLCMEMWAWTIQDPLSWKCFAQRDTVGKEQDKELGKYVNPVLLCLLMAAAECMDIDDALKLFVAALASSAHSQTLPTREATAQQTQH